ncbi:MAG: DM13 domain-containing protein [Alphaproteobacteria bacterium]
MIRSTFAVLALAGATALAGCMQSGNGGNGGTAAATDAAATTAAASGLETARGSFQGQSGHTTTGSASVFWTGSQWVVALSSDFSQDDAPDPVVGLGVNGAYDPAAKLGPLQAMQGAQVYPLPAGLDIGDYLEVYIWCEEFAVPLGVAPLTLL